MVFGNFKKVFHEGLLNFGKECMNSQNLPGIIFKLFRFQKYCSFSDIYICVSDRMTTDALG